jgi:NAD(P)-dependent dehydrogenase (short-subunit alcohol dehydrogenase family)
VGAKTRTLSVIGGSRGIGAAIVCLAAENGYRVALGFHEQRLAAETITRKIIEKGGDAVAFPLNVADFSSVESFFDRVSATYGIPDAVAYCAGVTGPQGTLMDLRPDSIAQLFATNLTGAFFCVQSAAKRMAISRGGRGGAIVTLSSEAGRFGGNRISPYAASKAGINAMTKGVARELASEGIRLNAVSPGIIDTDQHSNMAEERRVSLLATIPIGRMGRPEEVAKAVLWMLSDEASYVTGVILTVAGGR